ncbi:MAG TPA: potassium channel family protein [Mariprofundaceae bacterium]|nr:potassium channel family protein [Mariprofundaceae bacterium]
MNRRHVLQRVLDVLLFVATLGAVAASFMHEWPDWVLLAALLPFVILFFVRWYVADDRRGWIRSNWFDLALVVLLASPILRLLMALKLVGLVPALRIGVLIRANRERLLRLFVISGESWPAAMALMSTVVFVFGTAAFLIEHPHNPAFGDVSDGLWWAFVTMTTVGYGDIVPQSGGGRIVGVLTMVFGIAVYSLAIANLTVFIERYRQRAEPVEAERNASGEE